MTRRAQSRFVNALTFARVPLIFVWAVLAIVQEFAGNGAGSLALALGACLAMLLSGLTDAWDGALARRRSGARPFRRYSTVNGSRSKPMRTVVPTPGSDSIVIV